MLQRISDYKGVILFYLLLVLGMLLISYRNQTIDIKNYENIRYIFAQN